MRGGDLEEGRISERLGRGEVPRGSLVRPGIHEYLPIRLVATWGGVGQFLGLNIVRRDVLRLVFLCEYEIVIGTNIPEGCP